MSIARRLWLQTLTTLVLLVAVLAVLLATIRESDAAARSRQVAYGGIFAIETVLSTLKDAETAQRGYLLTGRPSYLGPLESASHALPREIAALREDSVHDPQLRPDVERLSGIVDAKLAELRQVIAALRSGGFGDALKIVNTDRGQALMEQARAMANEMEETLRVQVAQRDREVREAYVRLLAILALGGLSVACASVFINIWIVSSIRRQQEAVLSGVQRVAGGDLSGDMSAVGGGEFGRVAAAFNGMVEDLRGERLRREAAEKALARSNAALRTQADGLTRKNHAAEMLSRLAARLTGCDDEAEVAEVIGELAPLIVRSGAGALYTRAAADPTTPCERWRSGPSPPARRPRSQPSDCWGVRDGRPHVVHWTDSDATCRHVDRGAGCACRCLPIVAQDQTVGLLYLEERDMALALPLDGCQRAGREHRNHPGATFGCART